MARRDFLHAMVQSYGDVPDLAYFPGDMASIRSYFDYMQLEGDDPFLVDDTTWDDLDMDAVFKRINLGLSNSGEQYLYYLLHAPAQGREELARRRALVALMEREHHLRERLHYLLAGLGRRSNVHVFDLLQLEGTSFQNLFLYVGLAAGLLLSILLLAVTYNRWFLLLSVTIAAVNLGVHLRRRGKEAWKINTIQYCAAMAATLKKLCGWGEDKLEPYLISAREPLRRLQRLGGLGVFWTGGGFFEVLSNFLLLDLILFEIQKSDLSQYQREFLEIHRSLGELDAAICIASYRKSVPRSTVPDVEFSSGPPFLLCKEVVHPLIEHCVPNSVDMRTSILLIGSNASGKTTFLRALAINLILAQGICTALAEEFHCSALRVLTSIDIRDSLASGESYYTAELRSLRRVVDAVEEAGAPVFCCLDETLRGTNAVERISASAELLAYLGGRCLCAAATHDVELCAILSQFTLYHFEERIEDGEMRFDYRLKPGYSTTSNAIKLLGLMGFPGEVVKRAEQRASHYLAYGEWRPGS